MTAITCEAKSKSQKTPLPSAVAGSSAKVRTQRTRPRCAVFHRNEDQRGYIGIGVRAPRGGTLSRGRGHHTPSDGTTQQAIPQPRTKWPGG